MQRESSDVHGGASPPISYDGKQRSFHRFDNPALEREFVAYIHPKLMILFPVIYSVALAALLPLQFTASDAQDSAFQIRFALYVSVATIGILVSAALHFKARRNGGPMPFLLTIERCIFVVIVIFAIAIDLGATLARFQGCDGAQPLAGDRRKAFRDAQCRKWWGPLGVIYVSAFSMIPIFRTIVVAGVAVYTIVLQLTMWILIPPPDMLYQVWLFSIFVAAGVQFVTFVRYDQESVQRQQFLKWCELKLQREQVTKSEAQLRKFASKVLPDAFLQRFARVSSEGAVLDQTEDGVVLMAGVHDFGRWATTQVPLQCATAVIFFQSLVRTQVRRHGLDFIGTQGDTVVITGNLVQPITFGRQRAMGAALGLLRISSNHHLLPPIRGSIALGTLSGSFVGTSHVRYDVFGPTVEAAQTALLACPANCFVMAIASDNPSTTNVIQLFAPPASRRDSSSPTPVFSSDVLTLDDLQLMVSQQPSESGHSSSSDGRAKRNANGFEVLNIDENSGQFRVFQSKYEETGDTTFDDLGAKLQRYEEETKVWCCFPRFVDDDVEDAYVKQRMRALPGAASRTWLAYAGYTAVMLLLLLVDLEEPQGAIGALLLSLAIVLSIAMAALPQVLSEAQMASGFFTWSMLGVVLPLLLVFGSAASRPSAVGIDPRAFLFVGALVRSYCFASSRWQFVFIPIFAIVGIFEFLLPGGQLRLNLGFILMGVFFNLMAERERERLARDNVRRQVQLEFMLAKLEATDSMRKGLLRSAIPRQLLDLVGETKETTATQVNGVAVAIRATPVQQSSAGIKQELREGRFDALEFLLLQAHSLAISSILGDQAVIVGPVTLSAEKMSRDAEKQTLIEAVWLARRLGEATQHGDKFDFTVIVDTDSMVHALETGEVSQYWALGVTVTRLVSFMAATDATTHRGCYVTERVVQSGNTLSCFDDALLTDTGPMKLRGVGMIRLSKVQRRFDDLADVVLPLM